MEEFERFGFTGAVRSLAVVGQQFDQAGKNFLPIPAVQRQGELGGQQAVFDADVEDISEKHEV